MSASSYQAQQVLAELRKRLGMENKAAPDSGVRVSTITILEDDEPLPQDAVVATKPFASVVSRTVVAQDTYAPAVSRELERRAGSFMQPPVAPRQPAAPIPKTGLKPTPPPPSRKLGEAD